MEILVCVKRVPDTSENEIEVNRDGTDIERDDLVYSVNEWDNYAVEEAIQIRERWAARLPLLPSEMRKMKRSCEEKWPWALITAYSFRMKRLKDPTEEEFRDFKSRG